MQGIYMWTVVNNKSNAQRWKYENMPLIAL